jgi:signal transduction histidine kinase
VSHRVSVSRRDAFDAAVAALLLLAGLADWTTGVLDGTYPEPRWAHLPFIVATAVPLAFRRRRPLLAFLVFGVLQTVWIDLLFGLDVQPPIIPFVQLLVVVYSAAAYCDGRESRAAAVVFALGVASDIPPLVLGKPLGLVATPNIALVIAFLVGLAFARLRRRTDEQAEALARAELERQAAAEQAAAEERARIARELHDVISHDVSLMVLQASVERRVHTGDDATAQALKSIESTGREALAELRRMLGVLRHDDSAPLRPQPGLAQLPDLVEQARAAGLPVDLVVDGQPVAVPPGLDIAAYRIVQESLTNAAKHAVGAAVTATLRYRSQTLEIEVVNARSPAPPTVPLPPGGGHGLVGMQERVSLFGGTIEAAGSRDEGFRLRAMLPLPR